MGEEEFLPDQEEKEIEMLIKDESSLSINLGDEDAIRQNQEIGGKMYKYDLPLENEAITFKSQSALMLADKIIESTPVENLYEMLEIDKDSAFESFIIKHNQLFNHEVDMYGDLQKAGDSQLKVGEIDLFIPLVCLL